LAARAPPPAVLAEAAGLVGATLARSPATGPADQTCPACATACLPKARGERSPAARRVAVASAAGRRRLPAPMTTGRPAGARPRGRLYRPVARELPFGVIVNRRGLGAGSVMHLTADTRPSKVSRTDLVRACRVGPLQTISRDEAARA
jgi:hypothetical protein